MISDMAPNLSAVSRASDQARAAALAELALEFALTHLKPQGNLLVKIFQGAATASWSRRCAALFVQLRTRKPEASRGRSSEVYLVGRRLAHQDSHQAVAWPGMV